MKTPRITQRVLTNALFAALIGMNAASLGSLLLGPRDAPSGLLHQILARLGAYALLLLLHLRGWEGARHALAMLTSLFTSLALSPAMLASGYPLGMIVPVVATAALSDWRGILASGGIVLAGLSLRLGPGVLLRDLPSVLVYLFCVLGLAGLWILLESTRLEALERAGELSRASERVRFQSFILDHVGQIVVAGDAEGRVTYWNEAAERLLGWGAGEAMGLAIGDLVYSPGDGQREAIATALAAGRSCQTEIKVQRKDGSSFPALITASPMVGAGGALEGWVGVGADISELKAAELALEESEQRLRTIVSNLPLVVFALDSEGRFTFSDGAGLALLGRAPGQAVGWSAFEHHRDNPEVIHAIREALGGQSVVIEQEMEGLVFQAHYVPLLGKDGSTKGVLGVAMDVSERHAAEAEVVKLNRGLEAKVAERTAQLRKANESLAAALAGLKDAQGKLVLSGKMAALGQLVSGIAHEVNTPLGAIAASSRVMMDGFTAGLLPLLRRLPGLDPGRRELCVEALEAALAEGLGADPAEERRRRRAIEPILARAVPPVDDSLSSDLALLGDESLALRLLPLAGAEDGRGLLEDLLALAAALRSGRVVEVAVGQASRVIQALRVYSRRESAAEPMPVDVRASLDVLLTLYRNKLKRGIEVATSYAESSLALGKPDELGQVWLNLVDNAVQAMEYRGVLSLATEVRGSMLAVTVGDDGPGISPEIADRVFEPFFTTKAAGEGTGLGLDIARRVVEAHGGSISFESRPGRTTFTVLLPRP